ncbi:(2Fe-2S) ferredoxin domain-containing protein [Stratiformator vulcanicus]|uniref:Ferredoxin, 2Fe-2S n=1 Tax=Stratiformator vulcanicus TaxID=2527980 RepID=A0A517QZE7_9PLAN|nr:(2Fe-2S) ferredoxin domain-containing protein [Stratiformator vulcanicus]QDT36920.1 Ferredoxin, 2Fe-2S [Stratiformator vulcanicus]
MPAFTHHIFVCGNQRSPDHRRGCCDPLADQSLRAAFKAEIAKHRLGPDVRANHAGCLEQCEYGPAVIIYPHGIHYGNVTIDDVPRIIAETVIKGRILEDLLIPDDFVNNATADHVRQWAETHDRPADPRHDS